MVPNHQPENMSMQGGTPQIQVGVHPGHQLSYAGHTHGSVFGHAEPKDFETWLQMILHKWCMTEGSYCSCEPHKISSLLRSTPQIESDYIDLYYNPDITHQHGVQCQI